MFEKQQSKVDYPKGNRNTSVNDKKIRLSDSQAERIAQLKKIEEIQKVPIPFFSEEYLEKLNGLKDTNNNSENDDKSPNTIAFDLYIDPRDEQSIKIKRYIKVLGLETVTPEKWCKHRQLFESIIFEGLGYQGDIDVNGRPTNSNALNRHKTFLHSLTCSIKNEFQKAFNFRKAQNSDRQIDEQKPFKDLLQYIYNDVAKIVFNDAETAYKIQKKYFRNNIFIGDMDFMQWNERFEEVNSLLAYFPKYGNTKVEPFHEDEKIDIVDRAAPFRWYPIMCDRGKTVQNFEKYHDLVQYIRTVENAIKVRSIVEKDNTQSRKRDRETETKSVTKSKKKARKRENKSQQQQSACPHCGKQHVNHEKCWTLPQNKNLRPVNWKPSKGNMSEPAKEKHVKAKQQAYAAVRKLPKTQRVEVASTKKSTTDKKKKKKMKVVCGTSSDSDSSEDESSTISKYKCKLIENNVPSVYNCTITNAAKQLTRVRRITQQVINKRQEVLSQNKRLSRDLSTQSSEIDNTKNSDAFSSFQTEFEYAYPFLQRMRNTRPAKKMKKQHFCAEVIVETEDRHGQTMPIRALLDTGTSSSIILREYVKRGRAKSYKGKETIWSTLGGQFRTNQKALIDFKFPEFSDKKTITWIMHVAKNSRYVAEIGRVQICDSN